MQNAQRKFINWTKTAANLRQLRQGNINLRRYVCRAIRVKKELCDGANCQNCQYEMDPSISRAELASVFNVTENMVFNWESAKSVPSLDDLLFYAQICEIDLTEVVVFD